MTFIEINLNASLDTHQKYWKQEIKKTQKAYISGKAYRGSAGQQLQIVPENAVYFH